MVRNSLFIIGAAILLVTALHLLTPLEYVVLHELYQRLYYMPIIAAAFWFGWRGGLAAATFASLAYLPHIWEHWQHTHYQYAINQYAEIVLFHIVGGTIGLLGDRRRRAQAEAERTAHELNAAYTELRRTFEQLLQADRLTSLGAMAAGLVHEVRNPLAGIKGAVEILADGLAPDNPRQEFAALAQREIGRLDNLVGDFLRFARPAAPVKQEVDLNELARSVAAFLAPQCQAHNVALELELNPHVPAVYADAGQIRQVLLNLALNAVQAMPDGGTLRLASRVATHNVTVSVTDTGGGIAPALASRIFDPFFTTKGQGTGLGLSIAYQIAQQHQGSLVWQPEAGGTTFALTLPLTQTGK